MSQIVNKFCAWAAAGETQPLAFYQQWLTFFQQLPLASVNAVNSAAKCQQSIERRYAATAHSVTAPSVATRHASGARALADGTVTTLRDCASNPSVRVCDQMFSTIITIDHAFASYAQANGVEQSVINSWMNGMEQNPLANGAVRQDAASFIH